MARVTFTNSNDHLSGTLCGMVYRTRNGKTVVHAEQAPVLPKNPTPEQRQKYLKERAVVDSVRMIQTHILAQTDRSVTQMQRVADMHNAIRTTVSRWYDYLRPHFASSDVLTGAIVYYFRCKHLPPRLALFEDELPMQKIQADCNNLWNLVEPLSSHPRTIVEPFA